jgi:hypothetical protein
MTVQRGGRKGEGGAKSDDGETAWSSVNHPILSGKSKKGIKSEKENVGRGGGDIKSNAYWVTSSLMNIHDQLGNRVVVFLQHSSIFKRVWGPGINSKE